MLLWKTQVIILQRFPNGTLFELFNFSKYVFVYKFILEISLYWLFCFFKSIMVRPSMLKVK